MPELPEVETVRSGLEKAWVGRQISKVILRRENLRYPFPEDLVSRLEGSTIVAVRRRAKYLLILMTKRYYFHILGCLELSLIHISEPTRRS